MSVELSPKKTQYQKRVEKGLKPLTIWLEPKLHQQLKLVASSVQEPLTVWSRRALIGAMTRWKSPKVDRELWAKCSFCGNHHDEKEHYPEG